MKRQMIAFFALVLLALVAKPVAAQTQFILQPTPNGSAAGIASLYGLTLIGPVGNGSQGIYLVSAPTGVNVQNEIADVDKDSDVSDFELDEPTAIAESPASLNQSSVAILDNYPNPQSVPYFGTQVLGLYATQPAVATIHLSDAQSAYSYTGAGVVVAIIDTGVDPNHAGLQRVLVPGYDFVNNIAGSGSELVDLTQTDQTVLSNSSSNPATKGQQAKVNQSSVAILDQSTLSQLNTQTLPAAFGHGTMVAGVIHLMAPGAKIMPLKAFRGDGTANLSAILDAIYYAADHGANIINMSFSLLTSSNQLSAALAYAANKGVVLVASTGNTGTSSVANPAAMDNVMGVASSTNDDWRSAFSSYGEGTFVAAPGEQVITFYPGNNYAVASGTSFSAPMVSGTAALALQAFSSGGSEGANHAISNAEVLPSALGLGNGELNVLQAIQAALNNSEGDD